MKLRVSCDRPPAIVHAIAVVCTLLLSGTFSELVAQQVDPQVQRLLNLTSLDSLMRIARELSGDVQTTIGGASVRIASRYIGTPGHSAATKYIKQKLEGYGYTVKVQPFIDSTSANVYAVQSGSVYPNRKWIICGHYDDMPQGDDSPGADDNGSGTAAVLEAARVFSHVRTKQTVIFALWDREEIGYTGSITYAQLAHANKDSILGVINIDMIGYDSNNDGKMEIHTSSVGRSRQLADTLLKINLLYNIGLKPTVYNPGGSNSDQASFWQQGYTAVWLIESYWGGDANPGYHTLHDSIKFFNTKYYANIAKLAIATLGTVAGVDAIGPLQVQVADFTAARIRTTEVQLSWHTLGEVANYGFSLERRLLGDEEFAPLAGSFVRGHGTTNEPQSYTLSDSTAPPGPLAYRLAQIDLDGTSRYCQILVVPGAAEIAEFPELPRETQLFQNYPNPFNPSTTIRYGLPSRSNVALTVYDILGQQVAILVDEIQGAGSHEVTFDATGLASGVYLYRLQAGMSVRAMRLLLLR